MQVSLEYPYVKASHRMTILSYNVTKITSLDEITSEFAPWHVACIKGFKQTLTEILLWRTIYDTRTL
jgi:hypothetical protein